MLRLAALAAAVVVVVWVNRLVHRRLSYRDMLVCRACCVARKAELHAHLSGSVSTALVAVLGPLPAGAPRDLDACFARFRAIHAAISTEDALRLACHEVLATFAADNTAELELRTTPRALADASAADYVRIVSACVDEFDDSQRRLGVVNAMRVSLVLSLDRAASPEAAEATVDLAVAHRPLVVGVDLSGNPTKGEMPTRALDRARRAGLRTTLHCAEVPAEEETDAMLDFGADRLGHALFLTPRQVRRVLASKTPVELCPTSNLATLGRDGLADHPTAAMWLRRGHPISVNTDDAGVFGTSLSNEYMRVALDLGLGERGVHVLAASARSQRLAL